MSIIHKALKKAEKDRDLSNQERSETIPIMTSKNSKKNSRSIILAALFFILVMTAFILFKFFDFPMSFLPFIQNQTKHEAPIKTASQTTLDKNQEKTNLENLKKEALMNYENGNYSKSIDLWKKLSSQTKLDAEVNNNMGLAYKKIGSFEKAKDFYKQALKLKPKYPEALNNLGILLMQENNDAEALKLFEKALNLNPNYAEAHFHKALNLDKNGKKFSAAKSYENFLRLKQNIPDKLKKEIENRILKLKGSSFSFK